MAEPAEFSTQVLNRTTAAGFSTQVLNFPVSLRERDGAHFAARTVVRGRTCTEFAGLAPSFIGRGYGRQVLQ